MEKGTIIFTFDDVLSLTTYELYEYLLSNFRQYDHMLDLYTLRTKKDIYARKEKNIIEYLLNKQVLDKKTDQQVFLTSLHFLYLSLFSNFYSNPQEICRKKSLTSIATNALANPILTETNGIQKLVILFKYRTEKEKQIKYNFIKLHFNSDKLEIVPLKMADSYSEIIKNKYFNWDLVVTDDIDCVEELAKGNIDHKEFLLPQFGYNEAKPELVELIKQKSGSISYYKIEK